MKKPISKTGPAENQDDGGWGESDEKQAAIQQGAAPNPLQSEVSLEKQSPELQRMATELNQLEREIAEIDAAVNPRLIPAIRHGVESMSHRTNEQLFKVGNRAYFSIPADLKQQLAELEAQYQDAIKVAVSHTQRDAANAFRARQEEIQSGVVATGSVSECKGETQEEWEAVYRHRMQAAIALSKTFSPKAHELVAPHVKRFVDNVRDYADQAAINERDRYEDIGLEWCPSNFIIHLYKCAAQAEANKGRGASPKDCAAFLALF